MLDLTVACTTNSHQGCPLINYTNHSSFISYRKLLCKELQGLRKNEDNLY